jgi:outer membrane immunogenic protein
MNRYFLGLAGLAVAVVASSANAADLRTPVYKAPPAVAPAAYNWSGCYIGIEGGGNWGRSSSTAASGTLSGLRLTSSDLSGGLLGGTVGCNYQVSTWVFGIEDDLSWTNKRGSANDLPPFNVTATNEFKEKWIDTLRGRFGFAWDRALFYATGGVAFADTSLTVCGVVCASDSRTRTGWTVGGGIEYAVWENVSLKLEYLHVDFGTARYIDPPVTVPGVLNIVTRDVRLTDDIVRAGLNWRFNWGGPVVARY